MSKRLLQRLEIRISSDTSADDRGIGAECLNAESEGAVTKEDEMET